MNDSEDKKGQTKKKLRCDPKQLNFLNRCLEKGEDGIAEWNQCRRENPDKDIHLDSAILNGSDLKGIYLNSGYFQDDKGNHIFSGKVYLRNVMLEGAHLEEAELSYAQLEDAGLHGAYLKRTKLERAHLERADLLSAHIEGAELFKAHLQGAWLCDAHLENVDLRFAHMKDADLSNAHFEGSDLKEAHLEGANLYQAHLEGADFRACSVDGLTIFWECSVDGKTDFRGVGLETCRIDEGTKYLLQYNRRRMNCEDWYKEHPRLAPFAKAFFSFSDYGNSTWRIIQTFLIMATCFAIVYYIWGAVDYYLLGVTDHPGIVTNLFVSQHGPVDFSLVLLRSIYFSIVTMTTLGFGDMYANANNYWLAAEFGHLLLMLQVILGYVLLGALVTRFGVLFTSGLIPGKFKSTEDRRQKTDDREQKI